MDNRRFPPMLYRLIWLGVLALAGSLAMAATQPELRVSAIPDEAPTELQRKFAPLGAYLTKALHAEVKFVPVSDYPAVVEALAAGKLDMAWLGGFTYVQAKRLTHGTALPIVQRAEDTRFTARFITANPAIRSLDDLRGKTFAFGSPSSTSGHLMPRYFLKRAGIDPDRDFKRTAYSGAHDATAAFVASGKVDAGVLNASVWDKLAEQGKVDSQHVRVFHVTPPFFDYNWTVRGDLNPEWIKRLVDAFLALDPANPEHRTILESQRASRFIPTQRQNYDGIEAAAKEAGLLN